MPFKFSSASHRPATRWVRSGCNNASSGRVSSGRSSHDGLINTLSAVVLMPTRIGPMSPNLPAECRFTTLSQCEPLDEDSFQGCSALGSIRSPRSMAYRRPCTRTAPSTSPSSASSSETSSATPSGEPASSYTRTYDPEPADGASDRRATTTAGSTAASKSFVSPRSHSSATS